MTNAADVAALAALLGDPTRAAFCLALLDGRAWTAGELARLAGVSPATASQHLDRLVRGGLLAEERQGRHRYLRLAGADAAHLVEVLSSNTRPTASPSSYASVRADADLAAARTCYDHLAGRLGVGILDALDQRGRVTREDGIALTASGAAWLETLGIDVAGIRSARRPVVRLCLDWTERRSHLAGGVGAALAAAFLERDWIRRTDGRAIRVTDAGRSGLRRELGLAIG
ncbi:MULTISPECIES: ArsR/SmtB family transcription factor [unclassified Leifsonia]|uniref:ArsR/SmtB family transcription factor n=1 Tax=unclassified Leifsonia TaxID=2663824 RepID=UPI0006F3CABE|nr:MULTISPECIES: winged helix-turn-helix domain-containing protein [unclassified Leifsonia]KQX07233.1 ArsR family transcriptional regulator [Leifsonia sp. Root1293]KRA11516.1 ArsR family transcriptional regulator [Leifsonia sp. Root60]